ncbi:hypothetical protein HYV10_02705 [Candidatus Dependentiae bacterium]|nr:hypothetical protein [Candidatus Dependentiae bacterium]
MKKKIYIKLLVVILISNYTFSQQDGFIKVIGRTLSSNGNSSVTPEPNASERISFNDAKQLKKDLNEARKNVSRISKKRIEPIKAKVEDLNTLIKGSVVHEKNKNKKGNVV